VSMKKESTTFLIGKPVLGFVVRALYRHSEARFVVRVIYRHISSY